MRQAVMPLLLCLVAIAAAPALDPLTFNCNLLIAQRKMNDGEWKDYDLERQTTFGLMTDLKVALMPFHAAVDILNTQETGRVSGSSFEGQIWEVNAGVRKYMGFIPGPVTPYIGGGVTMLYADVDGEAVRDKDAGYGFWFNGGASVLLGRYFNLGVDLRYSQADVSMDDLNTTIDAGGITYGAFIGLHW